MLLFVSGYGGCKILSTMKRVDEMFAQTGYDASESRAGGGDTPLAPQQP